MLMDQCTSCEDWAVFNTNRTKDAVLSLELLYLAFAAFTSCILVFFFFYFLLSLYIPLADSFVNKTSENVRVCHAQSDAL